MKRIEKLIHSQAVFLSCDIQTKFVPLIYGVNHLLQTASLMNKSSEIFQIPLVISEHNPKAFGETANQLYQPNNAYKFEKSQFSMLTPSLEKHLTELKRSQIVLYGIEAHVCIYQTAIDLLNNGYQVSLLTDATSSQRQINRSTAFRQLEKWGVRLETVESTLFQYMVDYKNPVFKDILKSLKQFPVELQKGLDI